MGSTLSSIVDFIGDVGASELRIHISDEIRDGTVFNTCAVSRSTAVAYPQLPSEVVTGNHPF